MSYSRSMAFHGLLCVVSLLLGILSTVGLAKDKKDIEIALLRQQLRVLERWIQTQLRCTRVGVDWLIRPANTGV